MIPKIAFLFLTISNVFHEQTWVNFFKGHEHIYSIYVHAKERTSPDSFFNPYEMKTKVYTSWSNTMKAQIALVKAALKDPANQKFVFISESTIPLQSFEDIYAYLMRHDLSEFNYWKNPDSYRKFDSLKPEDIYKNAQWVVLNRKHAQLMANDQDVLPRMINDPHDQEHYPSTFLGMRNLLDEVIKQDTTLCIWAGGTAHPHMFESLETDPYLKKLIKIIEDKRFLFARKFSKKCNLSPLKKYCSWMNI